MSVSVQLSFSPKEISLNYFECPSDDTFNAFDLTSCFMVNERTSSTGSLEKTLNVSLNLNVDVLQGLSRGFFDPMDSSSRTLQQFILLDSGFSCFNFSIFMLRCVADTVSPLKIRMNFAQTEMLSGNSMAVLDVHSRTEEYVEVPFHSRTYVEATVRVKSDNQIMLIIGISVGGGLIVFIIILVMLVKRGFFKRMRPKDFFQTDENVTLVKKTEDSVETSAERKEGSKTE